MQRDRRNHLKYGDRRARIDALELLKSGGERVIGRERPCNTNAFVEADEMRRGVDMHAHTRGLSHCAQERARAALAIGAADMNYRRKPALGMAYLGEQVFQAPEAQIDEPRV